MARISMIIVGLLVVVLALGIGARWLLVPETAAGDVGIVLSSPLAFSTARGDMGGAFLALGIVAGLGLARREPRYLEAVAIVVGAVAVGRLIALAIDGFDGTALVAILTETIFFVALVAVARRMDETPGI